MRRLFALLLLAAVVPCIWLRSPPRPSNDVQQLRIDALAPVGRARVVPGAAGDLALRGVWHLTSPNTDFGGYSGLTIEAPGRFLALSDKGKFLRFALPAASAPGRPSIGLLNNDAKISKDLGDCEAVARDPLSGTLWCAYESFNAVFRYGPDLREQARYRPPAMQDWPSNKGPESMARLADGRFLIIAETFESEDGGYPALLFPGDPTLRGIPAAFTFTGPDGFRPTDAAQLPDGRVLILMRRLLWPMPARFAAKLAIADPAEIAPGGIWAAREIASFGGPVPLDNYEGLAVEPQADGSVRLWIISDDNDAVTQRTLLLELALHPDRIPRAAASKPR